MHRRQDQRAGRHDDGGRHVFVVQRALCRFAGRFVERGRRLTLRAKAHVLSRRELTSPPKASSACPAAIPTSYSARQGDARLLFPGRGARRQRVASRQRWVRSRQRHSLMRTAFLCRKAQTIAAAGRPTNSIIRAASTSRPRGKLSITADVVARVLRHSAEVERITNGSAVFQQLRRRGCKSLVVGVVAKFNLQASGCCARTCCFR